MATVGVSASRPSTTRRRTQLAGAAATRFHRLGYHQVSLADVASDVGVTAPAVYRHFRGKQDLLAGAIGSGLTLVEEALAQTDDAPLDVLVTTLAELVLDRPDLWTLLQREVRFLDPELRSEVRQQLGRVIAGLLRRIRARRPDLAADDALLLVTAATAALATPSVPGSTPRALVGHELARSAMAILELPWPVTSPGPTEHEAGSATDPDDVESRRTALLDSAIDLFFHRGYAAVSLDDIGASVGIAGPSIYHHFPTKADLLAAAFSRATDRLIEDHDNRAGTAPQRSLAELVGVYTDFCLRNRRLVGVYVSEANNLPQAAQRRVKAVLRDRTADWTAALGQTYPAVDQRVTRLRVLTALTVIDDLARIGPFHARPRIAVEVRAVAMAILIASGPG